MDSSASKLAAYDAKLKALEDDCVEYKQHLQAARVAEDRDLQAMYGGLLKSVTDLKNSVLKEKGWLLQHCPEVQEIELHVLVNGREKLSGPIPVLRKWKIGEVEERLDVKVLSIAYSPTDQAPRDDQYERVLSTIEYLQHEVDRSSAHHVWLKAKGVPWWSSVV